MRQNYSNNEWDETRNQTNRELNYIVVASLVFTGCGLLLDRCEGNARDPPIIEEIIPQEEISRNQDYFINKKVNV